jgi:RNA polymerase sigma-70 factor (ECF subfamily)
MNRTHKGAEALAATEAGLRALLIKGLDGDADAYGRFLQALSAHLRAYLRRRLFQYPADVEDVLQEALLAVHNQRHTYLSDQPLTAWVHATPPARPRPAQRGEDRPGRAGLGLKLT